MIATIMLVMLLAHIILWFFLTEHKFWLHTRHIGKLRPSAISQTTSKVAVFVPARNEEKGVGAAINSLLSQDYDNLSIAVADDHSTDRTGEILNAIKRSHPHLSIYTPDQPPPGWMGKCHALWWMVEREQCDAEWYLFTDADVIHESDTIRRAVAHGEATGADLIAIMPRVDNEGLWENMIIPVFMHLGVLTNDPRNLNDATKREFAGIGAFTLIRKRLYDHFDGHETIRNEVIDDMALGLLAKREGGKLALLRDGNAVHLRMYDSLPAIVSGFRKNMHAAVGNGLVSSLRAGIGLLFLHGTPLAAFPVYTLVVPHLNAALLALAVYIATGAVIYQRASRYTRNKAWITISLYPFGAAIAVLILWLSAYDGVFHRRVRWRGRDSELGKQQVRMY